MPQVNAGVYCPGILPWCKGYSARKPCRRTGGKQRGGGRARVRGRDKARRRRRALPSPPSLPLLSSLAPSLPPLLLLLPLSSSRLSFARCRSLHLSRLLGSACSRTHSQPDLMLRHFAVSPPHRRPRGLRQYSSGWAGGAGGPSSRRLAGDVPAPRAKVAARPLRHAQQRPSLCTARACGVGWRPTFGRVSDGRPSVLTACYRSRADATREIRE